MRRYNHFHRKEKRQPSSRAIFIVKEILITWAEIVLVIFLAYFITDKTLLKSPVSSESMSPTLKLGDVIIVNKLAYEFSLPARNDVIVYKQAGREHSYYEISRVIGLPGEKVRITNGTIYINDNPIEEKINVPAIKNSGLAEDGVVLDNNEFFVLGDNRNKSEDSRFANVGNIIKSDIIGKAVATEKPFSFVSKLNLKENAVIEDDKTSSSIAKE